MERMSGWIIAGIAIIAGFFTGKISRKPLAEIIAWGSAVVWVIAGKLCVSAFSPAVQMLALVFLLFTGMKTVVVVYRYPRASRLNFRRWLCFVLIWPGMNPYAFEPGGVEKMDWKLFGRGAMHFFSGTVLLCLLAGLLQTDLLSLYWLCLLSFPAFILIFHSGIFEMEAACLRKWGIAASPLMDAPQRSLSLGAFWGKRWNIPFIQMTRYTVFKPLLKKTNRHIAFLSSFLVSGLLHEVALSLPVNRGYGLPTLYFLIQALLILAERKLIRRIPFLWQKAWLFGCLTLPFPLLFHPAFLQEVFLPVLHKLGYWISLAL
jgi:alginate O-acetyltransferase complex protein AlgI